MKEPNIRVSEPINGILPVYVDMPMKLDKNFRWAPWYELFSILPGEYSIYFRKVPQTIFRMEKERQLIKRLCGEQQ